MSNGSHVCFGNSLTEGYRVPVECAYPSVLQQLTGVATMNLGVSGDTTGDGLRRLSKALALKPVVALVEFGLNDWYSGLPMSQAEENLATVIRGFQAEGSQVVLLGFSLPGEDTGSWERMYLRLRDRYRVTLMPDIFTGLHGGAGLFLEDGLHPSTAGYQIIARHCYEHLRENGLLDP